MQQPQALSRHKVGRTSVLTGGKGPPLVLLHGIPGTALSWAKAGAALSDRFEVFIPDMLGFGGSDPPAEDGYLEEQAAALAELLDARGITDTYLAGHDIGGPLALTLMRTCPQVRVRGLVVAAANLLAKVKITPFLKITRMRFLNGLVIRVMIGNRLAHRVLYRSAVVNKASFPWSDYAAHLAGTGGKYTRLMFQRTMLEFESTYAPIEAFLPGVTVPTLLVWGAGDPILRPSLGRKIQRIVGGAELKIYEETGHYVVEEQPERLATDIAEFFDP